MNITVIYGTFDIFILLFFSVITNVLNMEAKNTVDYHAMSSKSIEALKKLDFLNNYSGMLLHDHETALYYFGTNHTECNVHIIRYLLKNTEETGNKRSAEMIAIFSS